MITYGQLLFIILFLLLLVPVMAQIMKPLADMIGAMVEDVAQTIEGKNIEIPKWETPEEYMIRTLKEWPEEWAVYYNVCGEWEVDAWFWVRDHILKDFPRARVIIATHHGYPEEGENIEKD